MLFKTTEQKPMIRREILGGVGEAQCLYAIPRGEEPAGSCFKMAGKMTLEAGASIGVHVHDADEEIYVILSGKGVYIEDDGSRHEVGPGDVSLTLRGQRHGIEASQEGPLTLLALIAE